MSKGYSHVLNLNRVGFLCLVQRCGLTAAKAQTLSSTRHKKYKKKKEKGRGY